MKGQIWSVLLSVFSILSFFFFNLILILYKITKYTERAEFVTLVHTHTVNKSVFFFLMYGFAKVDYEVTFVFYLFKSILRERVSVLTIAAMVVECRAKSLMLGSLEVLPDTASAAFRRQM